MSDRRLLTTEVLIIGAGVLGLCTAVELTRRSHDVLVLDSGGQNASSVAAGMIAPALEAALDDASPDHAGLLREARDLWDAFAADLSIDLRPGPARWIGADSEALFARLTALGFAVSRRGDGLAIPEDAQVDPPSALAAMVAALPRPLLRATALKLTPTAEGWSVMTDAGPIEAGTLVVATGAARAIPGLPDPVVTLVADILPVRGQIGWMADRPGEGVLRTQGAYLAPSRGGTLVGATMEPGRRDLDQDPASGAALLAVAAPLLGPTPMGGVEWRIGIRGATRDGLPMAGPSGAPRLHLALAPRRNGWLLGPLVGRVVADGIADIDPGPFGTTLDPRRFA